MIDPPLVTLASRQRKADSSGAAQEIRMAQSHKYKVGQSVRYSSDALRRLGANSTFKIVRLLPSDGDQQQYQLKSASEAHERIAKENELSLDL
jgi:hypothetical protein